jgi:hypothetical protein
MPACLQYLPGYSRLCIFSRSTNRHKPWSEIISLVPGRCYEREVPRLRRRDDVSRNKVCLVETLEESPTNGEMKSMKGFESPKYLVRHRYYFHEVVMSRVRLRILSNRRPRLDRSCRISVPLDHLLHSFRISIILPSGSLTSRNERVSFRNLYWVSKSDHGIYTYICLTCQYPSLFKISAQNFSVLPSQKDPWQKKLTGQ